jgi:hypothetical protein
VAYMGVKRNAYRFLVGKPEGKGPFGRPRRGGGVVIVLLKWVLKK